MPLAAPRRRGAAGRRARPGRPDRPVDRPGSRCCTRGPTGSAGSATRSTATRRRSSSPDIYVEEHGLPLHGLRSAVAGWEVVDVGDTRLVAGREFAGVAEFPFDHRLEVAAELTETHADADDDADRAARGRCPIAFGYHPFFQLPGVPRAEWEITLPVGDRLLLDESARADRRARARGRPRRPARRPPVRRRLHARRAARPVRARAAAGAGSRSRSSPATPTPRSSRPRTPTSSASSR